MSSRKSDSFLIPGKAGRKTGFQVTWTPKRDTNGLESVKDFFLSDDEFESQDLVTTSPAKRLSMRFEKLKEKESQKLQTKESATDSSLAGKRIDLEHSPIQRRLNSISEIENPDKLLSKDDKSVGSDNSAEPVHGMHGISDNPQSDEEDEDFDEVIKNAADIGTPIKIPSARLTSLSGSPRILMALGNAKNGSKLTKNIALTKSSKTSRFGQQPITNVEEEKEKPKIIPILTAHLSGIHDSSNIHKNSNRNSESVSPTKSLDNAGDSKTPSRNIETSTLESVEFRTPITSVKHPGYSQETGSGSDLEKTEERSNTFETSLDKSCAKKTPVKKSLNQSPDNQVSKKALILEESQILPQKDTEIGQSSNDVSPVRPTAILNLKQKPSELSSINKNTHNFLEKPQRSSGAPEESSSGTTQVKNSKHKSVTSEGLFQMLQAKEIALGTENKSRHRRAAAPKEPIIDVYDTSSTDDSGSGSDSVPDSDNAENDMEQSIDKDPEEVSTSKIGGIEEENKVSSLKPASDISSNSSGDDSEADKDKNIVQHTDSLAPMVAENSPVKPKPKNKSPALVMTPKRKLKEPASKPASAKSIEKVSRSKVSKTLSEPTRRSTRTRIKPVASWKNEKVEYNIEKINGVVVKTVSNVLHGSEYTSSVAFSSPAKSKSATKRIEQIDLLSEKEDANTSSSSRSKRSKALSKEGGISEKTQRTTRSSKEQGKSKTKKSSKRAQSDRGSESIEPSAKKLKVTTNSKSLTRAKSSSTGSSSSRSTSSRKKKFEQEIPDVSETGNDTIGSSANDSILDSPETQWQREDKGRLTLSIFEGPGTEKQIKRTIAYAPNSYKNSTVIKNENEYFKVATLFDQDCEFCGGGIIELPQGSKKAVKSNHDTYFIFYVIQGEIEVTLTRNTFVVTTGCSFEIPMGNYYQFINKGNSTGKMMFVQSKYIVIGDNASSDSEEGGNHRSRSKGKNSIDSESDSASESESEASD